MSNHVIPRSRVLSTHFNLHLRRDDTLLNNRDKNQERPRRGILRTRLYNQSTRYTKNINRLNRHVTMPRNRATTRTLLPSHRVNPRLINATRTINNTVILLTTNKNQRLSILRRRLFRPNNIRLISRTTSMLSNHIHVKIRPKLTINEHLIIRPRMDLPHVPGNRNTINTNANQITRNNRLHRQSRTLFPRSNNRSNQIRNRTNQANHDNKRLEHVMSRTNKILRNRSNVFRTLQNRLLHHDTSKNVLNRNHSIHLNPTTLRSNNTIRDEHRRLQLHLQEDNQFAHHEKHQIFHRKQYTHTNKKKNKGVPFTRRNMPNVHYPIRRVKDYRPNYARRRRSRRDSTSPLFCPHLTTMRTTPVTLSLLTFQVFYRGRPPSLKIFCGVAR